MGIAPAGVVISRSGSQVVAVQDRRALFNAFIASSPDQLVGFAVEVGLEGPLRPSNGTEPRARQADRRAESGKGDNVGVDLFHGVVSFGC